MAEVGIAKANLDESKYSSPIPMIGLYVAGASLVCFLLILVDTLNGICHKRRWLPCRWFSLNSVTLTLLSIATKLSVDLTTPMPRVQDQLSKLTSTIFLCSCMCFLLPSIGTMKHPECLTNMSAISILVVTIIMNISIQIYTGVIFLFKVEHIVILCCMMIWLILLWCSTFSIKSIKEISIDRNKSVFVNGQDSMLHKLKLCYLYGYDSNPQFAICKQHHFLTSCVPCLTCLVVLVEIAYRSVILKNLESYQGTSDYKWSTWIIVVIQIVTILLASFGNSSRIMLLNQINDEWVVFDDDEVNNALDGNPLLESGKKYAFSSLIKSSLFILVIIIMFVASIITFIMYRAYKSLRRLFCWGSDIRNGDVKAIEEFQDLIGRGEMELGKCSIRNGIDDMKRWMEKTKSNAFEHLIQLLSRSTPFQEESLVNQLKNQTDASEGYRVSSLTIVLLVKIAIASMPYALVVPLKSRLDEIFEIINFIDKKMNFTNLQSKKKCKVAKAAWKGPGFTTIPIKTNVITLGQALQIIRGLRDELPVDFIHGELCIITNFINRREYHSIGDLYNFIEQLFLEILSIFLTQLPSAISKHIMESDPEDFEERVRTSMKFLCRIGSLESHVRWSYPIGSNFTCLITDKSSSQWWE